MQIGLIDGQSLCDYIGEKTTADETILAFRVDQGEDVSNKAGYTAISCGRVGRGRNARFPTFQLDHHGPTNQPTDRPTDGQSLL